MTKTTYKVHKRFTAVTIACLALLPGLEKYAQDPITKLFRSQQWLKFSIATLMFAVASFAQKEHVPTRLGLRVAADQRRQAMSLSVSTLLTRNLHDVFGENDPCVGARPLTRSSPKIACSTSPAGAFTAAATRSIASRPRSGPCTLTFDISQSPSPRSWAMPGGSNG
jgi:hypothetical protein